MTTTANETVTRTNPRGTKRYKALRAADFTDTQALDIMGDTTTKRRDEAPALAAEVEVDPRVTQLVDGGFSPEQAERLVADQDGPAKKKGKKKGKKAKSRVKAQAETLSDKDRAEALVAQQGMAFTRGRVYSTPAIVEAQVRVLKTGRPEVVPTSGVGHIAAVLLYRETSGDCVIQNLKKPA